jgi:hypothetical protein
MKNIPRLPIGISGKDHGESKWSKNDLFSEHRLGFYSKFDECHYPTQKNRSVSLRMAPISVAIYESRLRIARN